MVGEAELCASGADHEEDSVTRVLQNLPWDRYQLRACCWARELACTHGTAQDVGLTCIPAQDTHQAKDIFLGISIR